MNTERLLHLIEILEDAEAAAQAPQARQAPISGFDMGHWIHRDKCGTSACAIGLAALDARCQAEGLGIYGWNEKSGEYDIPVKSVEAFNSPAFSCLGFTVQPRYQGWTGFDATAKWADISTSEACWLFDPETYFDPWTEDEDQDTRAITPSMVIERIRRLVAEGRKGE